MAKPRVMLLSDVRGWAFDRNMKDLEEYCGDSFDFTHGYVMDWIEDLSKAPNLHDFDVVYVLQPFWPIDNILPLNKTASCLRSQWMFPHLKRKPAEEELNIVRKYREFHVVNKRAHSEYTLAGARVLYLTDPVNMRLFKDSTQVKGELICEWNGNSSHTNSLHEDVKGLHSIIKPSCSIMGVPLHVADQVDGMVPMNEMPAFYQKANLALCASLYEGASNSVMEAMGSGLAVIATDCGNHRELHDSMVSEYGFSGLCLVERTPEAFCDAIFDLQQDLGRVEEMGRVNRLEIERKWSWDVWASKYEDMFKSVLQDQKEKDCYEVRNQAMLSDVTVFFVTTGDPVAERAWEALKNQIGSPKLERVENVSPMSAAFQQMIDRCETPFFVQVDEDMILKPGAVLALYNAIQSTSSDVFMYAYMLWDSHLCRGIFGVKIYRHMLMSMVEYRDVQSCEQDHFKQLQKMGYKYIVPGWDDATLSYNSPQVQGLHGTLYHPRTAFERYLDLTEKYRDVGGSNWYAKYPYEFLSRIIGHEKIDSAGSLDQFTDLWAFLGAVCGLFSDLSIPRGEKDCTKLPRGFGELRSHLVPPPREGIIYSTAKCNGRCPHCLRTISPASSMPDFTPALTRRMLDTYPTMSGVCIAGFGEPTLNKDLAEIIDILQRRKICIGVITNGLHITEPNGELIGSLRGASYVSVSLNATNAKEHEEMYGVGNSWKKALNGIEALAKAGVAPTLSFIATKQTWSKIPEYLKTAHDLVGGVPGARVAIVNLLPHHEEGDKVAHESFMKRVLTTDDDLTALPAYQQMAKDLGLGVFVWPIPIEVGKQSRPSLCPSPFVRVGVDGFANVSPCSRISPPDPSWGTLDNRTWLGSDKILDLRRQLMGVVPLRWECRFCFGNWSSF